VERTRGTGLGLAIVKYAAEQLEATLDLVSAPGRGTTVTVADQRSWEDLQGPTSFWVAARS